MCATRDEGGVGVRDRVFRWADQTETGRMDSREEEAQTAMWASRHSCQVAAHSQSNFSVVPRFLLSLAWVFYVCCIISNVVGLDK